MNVKYTKSQKVLEIIGLMIILGMIIIICTQWNRLPDKIPGHYNAEGEIDRWGNKAELIVIPVISVMLYSFISLITFIPSAWNVPNVKNENNKEAMYISTRNLLISTKIIMQGMFAYIAYCMTTAQALPSLFLPVTMIMFFGAMVFFIIRIYKTAKKK